MRELAKSVPAFTWAATRFGASQLAGLLAQPRQVAAAFDAAREQLARAAQRRTAR
jgi:hypothetical protein